MMVIENCQNFLLRNMREKIDNKKSNLVNIFLACQN